MTLIQIQVADGATVEYRPDSQWPRTAEVRLSGAEVKGLRLDGCASIDPHGAVVAFVAWKTDVAGADGGNDISPSIDRAALALCRKYAREARAAISTVYGRPIGTVPS